jgi:hypothetical protein
MLSYAPNFEDVMLARAFRDVGEGFWIDIGAGDPDLGSVTRAFSDRGWRGVNIEPRAELFARLTQARPRDINLNVDPASGPGQAALAKACRRHAPGAIHFLRLGRASCGPVPGPLRPWIIVAAAARGEAAPAPGYRLAWFDGGSRFHIAEERWSALHVHFQAPPNLFDGFIQYDPGDRSRVELARLHPQCEQLRHTIAQRRAATAPASLLRRAMRSLLPS